MTKPRFLLLILIVIVIAGSIFLSTNRPFIRAKQTSNQCQNIKEPSLKQKCWEDLMDQALQKEGLDQAFVLMDNLFQTEASFASECHGFAHSLGEKAYSLFSSNKQFTLPTKTSYCGYGFYHGLTELLLQTKGVKEAAKFCDSKKSQITQILYDACYHGIGHGVLSLTARDNKVWGNIQKMLEIALNLCNQTSNNPTEKSSCISGIFMELGNNFTKGQLKLDSIKNDPLAICRQQQDFSKMDCYTQMHGVLNMIGNHNLKESAKFVEDIKEDEYAVKTIMTLASTIIDVVEKDYVDNIMICRNLQNRLHLPCIQGLALGFMLGGTPSTEYRDAINFCKTNNLSNEEESSCYQLIINYSNSLYLPSEFNKVCQAIEQKYRKNPCII